MSDREEDEDDFMAELDAAFEEEEGEVQKEEVKSENSTPQVQKESQQQQQQHQLEEKSLATRGEQQTYASSSSASPSPYYAAPVVGRPAERKQHGLNLADVRKRIQTRAQEMDPERYEALATTNFDPAVIKKTISKVVRLNHISSILPGVLGASAKLFVGDIVEQAKLVMEERQEKGSIRPVHIREAHRRWMAKQNHLPAY